MRYCPLPSVTAVLVRSIRAGLAASTVTPGRTAPEPSFTVPVRVACARARDGSSRSTAVIAERTTCRIRCLRTVRELDEGVAFRRARTPLGLWQFCARCGDLVTERI